MVLTFFNFSLVTYHLHASLPPLLAQPQNWEITSFRTSQLGENSFTSKEASQSLP